MASFLACAWQKANGSSQSTFDNNDRAEDYLSPGVTASSSGDTIGHQSSDDTMEEKSILSPKTPEGFRHRKSGEEIRRELNRLPKRLNWEENDDDSPPTSGHFSGCMGPSCSVIPSIFLDGGSAPSPQVSASSFYNRSTRPNATEIAESPNLKIGQAKTAVGALLAMKDAGIAGSPNLEAGHARTAVGALVASSNSHGVSGSPSFRRNLPPHQHLILPPREWIHEEAANDFGIELPYEEFNGGKNLPPPPKSKGYERHSYTCLSDEESSIHASPSSLYRRNRNSPSRHMQHGDTSFTRSFLNSSQNVSRGQYDLEPILDRELIVGCTNEPINDVNMSGMSHHTNDHESLQSLHSLLEEDEDAHEQRDTFSSMKRDFRDTLRVERMRRERRLKEDLLLSTFERLQDNSDMVREVIRTGECSTSNWSLFTGFSRSRRLAISQKLDYILNNVQAHSQQENFGQQLSIPEYAEVYDDVDHALTFCRSLICAAVPSEEKQTRGKISETCVGHQAHRWKAMPGILAALGFNEAPRSPEATRGDDVSLFSLPSASENESTPHTSNVSMTTTITSAFSPERKGRSSLDGPRLRAAFESISLLFKDLNSACIKVLDNHSEKSEDTIAVSEEIKTVYLQLMSSSNDELKAIIDSFELSFFPLDLKRSVTDDAEDTKQAARNKGESMAPHYQEQIQPNVHVSWAQGSITQTPGPSGIERINVIEEDEDHHLFSPETEDMNSIERSLGTMDDLRRTVGSFENDDVVEEREAAPAFVPEAVDRKRSKRKALWRRRMPSNRRLTAE